MVTPMEILDFKSLRIGLASARGNIGFPFLRVVFGPGISTYTAVFILLAMLVSNFGAFIAPAELIWFEIL